MVTFGNGVWEFVLTRLLPKDMIREVVVIKRVEIEERFVAKVFIELEVVCANTHEWQQGAVQERVQGIFNGWRVPMSHDRQSPVYGQPA
jgi:hypothetical protein